MSGTCAPAPGHARAAHAVAASAASLAADVCELGLDCAVEARDRLAVLVPRGAVPALTDAAFRRRVAALAAARGFTHIALELPAGVTAIATPGMASVGITNARDSLEAHAPVRRA